MGVKNLKLIMKKRHMGNKELAEASGIPIGTLNKIIYGETKSPTLDNMQAIAKALDCTLDDFVAEDSYRINQYYSYLNEEGAPHTVAAHHDGDDWTPEEQAELDSFKAYLKSKRNKENE